MADNPAVNSGKQKHIANELFDQLGLDYWAIIRVFYRRKLV